MAEAYDEPEGSDVMGKATNAKESRWKRERLLIVAPVSDRISLMRISKT